MNLRGVVIWVVGCVLLTVVVVRYQVVQSRVPAAGGVAVVATEGSGKAESVFEEVAGEAGVDFAYANGEEADFYTILESLGGGVALLDYDGDGLLDLYFTGGGKFTSRTAHGIEGLPGRLYRNLGRMKFRDVTIAAGLSRAGFYSHGALVLDWDQDGRPDLLVSGYGGLVLYRNEDGSRFQDVTRQSGLTDGRWSTSVAAGDLWGRGRADLFVCRYVDWSFQNDPGGSGSASESGIAAKHRQAWSADVC